MNFIWGAIGMMVLLYFGTGYLGVAENLRFGISFWGGIGLAVLGAIGHFMGKPHQQGTQQSLGGLQPPITPPLGRCTAGYFDHSLRLTMGGQSNIYCRLGIAYVDAKNEISRRIIDITSYSVAATPDGEVVPYNLEAFCELRQAKRNFRADRIIQCADVESGLDITDLMGTLRAAPHTAQFDRKMAILRPISCGSIVVDYQFRAPNYKRTNITPTTVGYQEHSTGQFRTKTLLFVEGYIDGKDSPQRLRADRISGAWTFPNEAPIPDLAAHLFHAPPSIGAGW
ncbi:hypothetical protein [Acetobacter cibinongensis]|uniref:hypothetical protein n=1 Tax=Acetobacter cibinongensis TaxID=146475 RepID=UPI001055F255|nr:hypothetical protein [Acetobacter cibinongensis]